MLNTGKLMQVSSKKSLTYPIEILSCKLPKVPAQSIAIQNRAFADNVERWFLTYTNIKVITLDAKIIKTSLASLKILNAAPVFSK